MPSATPSLISHLAHGLDSMSETDRRIAKEILRAPMEVTSLSSKTLATRCQVSQSGIIKFCQKNGLSGFPALKIALSAEVARKEGARQIHGDIFSDDSIGSVARKIFDSKVTALSETMKLNNSDDIERAVTMIQDAERIIIFGIAGSALVATDLASKLTKFGKAVVFGGDSHIQLANLARFGPKDLLLTISYSGQTKEVTVAAEYAMENAIPLISIGGPKARVASSPGALNLCCSASEDLVRSASITIRTAQFAITDFLFVLLVQRQSDVADQIQESHDLVEKIR